MTREEAKEAFYSEAQAFMGQDPEAAWQTMLAAAEEWREKTTEAFARLAEKIKEQKKEGLAYFQFSVLRTNLIQEKTYTVVLEGCDARWYLDPEPVEVSFQMDGWFEEKKEKWESLYALTGKYMGKVSRYDVDSWASDTILRENSAAAHLLRTLLYDIEREETFASIPKETVYQIRYGEYRDASELVLKTDYVEKTQKQWEKALRMTQANQDHLVFSAWYRAEIKDSQADGKKLLFSRFEECRLEGVSFRDADLTGARFWGCIIEGCSFAGAVLTDADFSGSQMEENDFTGARMAGTVFSPEMLPKLGLETGQIQEIRLREEEPA